MVEEVGHVDTSALGFRALMFTLACRIPKTHNKNIEHSTCSLMQLQASRQNLTRLRRIDVCMFLNSAKTRKKYKHFQTANQPNQPTKPTNQPTNQPNQTNQPTKQPNNKPTSQPTNASQPHSLAWRNARSRLNPPPPEWGCRAC